MKTVRSFIVALVVLGNSIGVFAEAPLSDSSDLNTESTTIVQPRFEMKYDTVNQMVYVDIEGDFEELSSVSLANNRGSDILFNFIEGSEGNYKFDVSNLKSGSYFIILNTGEEIRMKRFVKE
ncbi:MAG: T9SS type A sorting domain-containing protein [Bacteroidetes bacterium]|nr:MAG: T9SS type A sorting domain-containing protein [Bacteroidota bacterium]